MNKTILIMIAYWIAAVLTIALILPSLGYSFALGMLMASLFLPGTFIVKYLLPKILKEEGKKKIANAVFLFIAVAIIEFLIIVSVHLWISDSSLPYPSIAGVLVNPMFVTIIITLLCIGDHFLSKWLKEKYPIEDSQITFISDRHKISLMPDEIIYIESNDREVTVFATEDRTYRNKTGISQWENILGDNFIRIHRSYIVNRASITSIDKDFICIGETELPISRKYYKAVQAESPQNIHILMKRILILLPIISFLASCSMKKEATEENNEVVIIVDGLAYSERFYHEYAKEDGAYTTRPGQKVFTFSSIDSNENIKYIRESGDTTTVAINADWVFVKYNFNPNASSDFIAHKGDTILIKRDTAKIYSRAQPQISVLNREAKPLDTEYRKAYLERFDSYEGLTIEEVENHHTLLWDIYDFDFTRGFKAWNEYAMKHHDAIVETLEKENVWIDSLNTAGMFSEPAYMYFKERVRWSIKKRMEFGHKGSLGEAAADSLFRADYDKNRYDTDVYGFYKGFINNVAFSSYFPKYVQISQGSTCDWEYTYAKLQKDTLIKGSSLYDSFLIRTLDGMLQDYPKHKSKEFIDMAVASSDSVFAYTLNERYKDAFAEDQMVENEVLLMSPDGKKTTLSKVLNSLKGKIVYVDFWASWCRPCCAEMEPAAELRERIKGKNVEFLYLSKDEDHDKMCSSLEKLQLKGCKVYRILNPKAARFMYEYNIDLIPRYMIIDHTGKIINDNAPRPSSEEIYTDLHID